MQIARQQAGCAVLVHHAFHAYQAVAFPGHGDASAAAGNHHDARLEKAANGILFHDAQRKGRCHHAAPSSGLDFHEFPVRPVAPDFRRFGGVIKASDRFAGVDHIGIAFAHQYLGDDGGRGPPDALAAKQFEQDALNHVPHAALGIGNARVQGKPGDAALAFFGADQDVADLRTVAVGDDDSGVALEKRNEMAQGLRGVFELLGNGSRLSGARNGIAAKSDDERFRVA